MLCCPRCLLHVLWQAAGRSVLSAHSRCASVWHFSHSPYHLLQGDAGIAGDPHLVHEAPEELIVTLESLHKALWRKHPQTFPVGGHLQAPPLSVPGLGLSQCCAGAEWHMTCRWGACAGPQLQIASRGAMLQVDA